MTATTDIPAAPWKSLFLEHISKLDDPYMSVATVGYDSDNESPVPRVRTCGFRGFFGELQLHPSAEKQLRDEKELNPSIYESDMLTFTTDVRMGKVEELQQFEAVEVLFWVKDIMAQWRLRGKAFVIGDEQGKSGEKNARAEISKGLRAKSNDAAKSQQWYWDKEVTAYFANHSPLMRGKADIIVVLCMPFIIDDSQVHSRAQPQEGH
jgi:pyridoxamine 5'-phosphate oxidase